MDDRSGRQRVAELEDLLDQVEDLEDPRAAELATELVSALLELHGEGLRRVVSIGGERAGEDLARALADDELVSQLLLLHGLHPVPVETRIREALEGVRPYLESHGGDVELLEVEQGVARLRLEGSCSGCPSSTMTLKLAIEEAIAKLAPEIERVEADGVVEPAPSPLLQIEVANPGGNGGEPAEQASWTSAGGVPEGAGERGTLGEVSGERILFVAVDGTPYAYRPDCAACGSSLEGAPLSGGELQCPGCGKHFDARRAGRCLDAPDLHLEPIPLLAEGEGGVKVALGAGAAT